MILADTSVWIEFLRNNEKISFVMRRLLEEGRIGATEWIFGELLQGARNNREAGMIRSYWENLPQLPSEGIWIEAGEYSREHKLTSKGVGLIDAAIVIAARREKAQIWTFDRKLAGLLRSEERFGQD